MDCREADGVFDLFERVLALALLQGRLTEGIAIIATDLSLRGILSVLDR